MANARAEVGCLPLPLQALTCSGSQDDQPLTMDEPDEFLPSCPISDIMSFWLQGSPLPRFFTQSHEQRPISRELHSFVALCGQTHRTDHRMGAGQRQMMWNHKGSCFRVLEDVSLISTEAAAGRRRCADRAGWRGR